jgi:hypothetical protein
MPYQYLRIDSHQERARADLDSEARKHDATWCLSEASLHHYGAFLAGDIVQRASLLPTATTPIPG